MPIPTINLETPQSSPALARADLYALGVKLSKMIAFLGLASVDGVAQVGGERREYAFCTHQFPQQFIPRPDISIGYKSYPPDDVQFRVWRSTPIAPESIASNVYVSFSFRIVTEVEALVIGGPVESPWSIPQSLNISPADYATSPGGDGNDFITPITTVGIPAGGIGLVTLNENGKVPRAQLPAVLPVKVAGDSVGEILFRPPHYVRRSIDDREVVTHDDVTARPRPGYYKSRPKKIYYPTKVARGRLVSRGGKVEVSPQLSNELYAHRRAWVAQVIHSRAHGVPLQVMYASDANGSDASYDPSPNRTYINISPAFAGIPYRSVRHYPHPDADNEAGNISLFDNPNAVVTYFPASWFNFAGLVGPRGSRGPAAPTATNSGPGNNGPGTGNDGDDGDDGDDGGDTAGPI